MPILDDDTHNRPSGTGELGPQAHNLQAGSTPAPLSPATPRPCAATPQAFYALYWRCRRAAWNAQPRGAHAPERLDAPALFRRFVAAGEAGPGCAKLDAYLSLWFSGVSIGQIRRGNMEELMAYGCARAALEPRARERPPPPRDALDISRRRRAPAAHHVLTL